ncbi:MAG: hypothetical protein AAF519_19260, partial [Bacteroidota bacterium]
LHHESKVFDIENGNGRRVSAELFNHTPGKKASYSLRLSGVPGEKEGLAHSIRVKKGDTIRSEVYAKYIELKDDPDIANVLTSWASPPVPHRAAWTEVGYLRLSPKSIRHGNLR